MSVRPNPPQPAGAGTGDALVANPLNQFAATSSSQFATVINDETGTGKVAFATGPTLAKVTLTAGTATAGTAPLKLTSGTNLTVVENGTFEYDGTHLYFSVGGVRNTLV
jgi:hypothetical protein